MKHIGKNIKKLRLNRCWTQEKVGKLLGISIAAYSNIETGKSDFNISRLRDIEKIFNVSTREILGGPEEQSTHLLSAFIEKLNKIENEQIKASIKLDLLYRQIQNLSKHSK